MTLADALVLRRALQAKDNGITYRVMRSGVRSPNVTPFYVAIDRSARP